MLQRQLLAENVPACREFFEKYFDDRDYLLCFVRWGANDGPDDAFENFNRWPELHALGADDEILRMCSRGHEGLLRQYTEARTTRVPIARQGMYYKEFVVQSDWMGDRNFLFGAPRDKARGEYGGGWAEAPARAARGRGRPAVAGPPGWRPRPGEGLETDEGPTRLALLAA